MGESKFVHVSRRLRNSAMIGRSGSFASGALLIAYVSGQIEINFLDLLCVLKHQTQSYANFSRVLKVAGVDIRASDT